MLRKILTVKYLSALLVIPTIVYLPVLVNRQSHETNIVGNMWMQVLIASFTYVPVFLLAIFYWSDGRLKVEWLQWRIKWKKHLWSALMVAVAMLVIILPLAKWLGNVLDPLLALSASALLKNGLPTLILMMIPLLSAFTEEIVYHYALTEPFINQRGQYVLMSLISNGLFTLIHINNVEWKLSGLVMYFLMGVMFQIVYLTSHRNIWQNIVTHLIYNALILIPIMLFMMVSSFF